MDSNYLGKRFLAYLIDMTVIMVFVTTLIEVKFLNPTYDEYNEKITTLENFVTSYTKSYATFLDYYSDNEISTEEYEDLINDNIFSNYFVDAYSDNTITEEEKDKIVEEVIAYYEENVASIYQDREYSCWFYYLVYIVVYLAYFVIFNIITKGATLGKKVMKLRITREDGTPAKWYQYLLRTTILFNVGILLISIFLPYIFSGMNFLRASYILSGIGMIIQIVIILTLIFNKSHYGLHDMLSKTKVVEE